MRGTLGVAASAALFGPAALAAGNTKAEAAADRFDFEEVSAGIDANHHVAHGYRGQVLLRWGDPLFPDSPAFNPTAQSADRAIEAVRIQQRLCRLLSHSMTLASAGSFASITNTPMKR